MSEMKPNLPPELEKTLHEYYYSPGHRPSLPAVWKWNCGRIFKPRLPDQGWRKG